MKERTADFDTQFEQFYATYYPKVKNFARLLTKQEQDAEDIAQNIFLKLWHRPDLWTNPAAMNGYLYTATKNEILNLFKHQKVAHDYETKIVQSHLIGELCDEDTTLLENLYYKEVQLLIKMKLNQLPPLRKQIFEMSRFEGLTAREIAERLQMPQRTVEDHIYKTLTELRKVLIYVIMFQALP